MPHHVHEWQPHANLDVAVRTMPPINTRLARWAPALAAAAVSNDPIDSPYQHDSALNSWMSWSAAIVFPPLSPLLDC
eukprot:scaffold151524_cov52-Attheya_sp.AAC.2